MTLPDGMLLAHAPRIIEFAARARIPAVFPDHEFATAGGLMTYGPSLATNFRQAATYVVKILRGANPADLPIEQPTKFDLVINLKTAKALGLTIPPSLLARADQVIE
jgi:putative ABC transport system substrate-binding protein